MLPPVVGVHKSLNYVPSGLVFHDTTFYLILYDVNSALSSNYFMSYLDSWKMIILDFNRLDMKTCMQNHSYTLLLMFINYVLNKYLIIEIWHECLLFFITIKLETSSEYKAIMCSQFYY